MYPNAIVSSNKFHSIAHSSGLVILSSILIGLFGQIAIPLPFTPVPIATQGSVILLLSCLLGPKRAFAAVVGFLAQGAAGFPVFAGEVGGLGCLIGPTGGYLLGYVAGALLTGYLFQQMENKSPMRLFALFCAGNALFFVFGVPCLAMFIGLQKALMLGVLPFLLGDCLKAIACVKILQWTSLGNRSH